MQNSSGGGDDVFLIFQIPLFKFFCNPTLFEGKLGPVLSDSQAPFFKFLSVIHSFFSISHASVAFQAPVSVLGI